MEELGHSFVSANKSTQCGLNVDWGAGANADSVDEMMFVANSSLSELVWTPSKGLSVKCADCSLPNKNSLLWCSESGDMIILPSQSIKGKEVKSNRDVDEEKLCSSVLAPNPENEIYSTEPLFRSPGGCVGIMPVCGTGSGVHKDNLKVDSNRDDELAKKEMNMCSISDSQKGADVNEKITASIAAQHDEDQDNVRNANSSSNRLEESRLDSGSVELEMANLTKGVRSKEKGKDIGGGDIQAACSTDILVSETSKMKQCDLPEMFMLIRSQNAKHAEPVSAFEETSGNKLSFPEKRESIAENDIKPLKTEDRLCCGRACAEEAMIVVSQPEGDGKHNPEKAMLIEASLNEKRSSLNRRKGKEKASPDSESSRSISKEEDRSHESVESSNSGPLFSKGRRTGNFDHQLIVGNKKIKRHQNETPCSASFLGQDSSFMNWISNMIKGLSNFDSDKTPCLALPPISSHHQDGSHDSTFMSHDKIQEDTVGRSTGFRDIFQALYCPRERLQNKIKCSLDQQTEAEVSKEPKVANKMPCDDASIRAAPNEKYKLQKFVHVGSPEEKGAIIQGSVDPNKCSVSAANRSPLESLWITRFSSKVSMPMLNSEQGHQDTGGTVEGFTTCNRLLPLSQNPSASIKDRNNLEDGCEPSDKDQTNAARGSQYRSVSLTGSCGSIRTKEQSYQKFKSELGPILPSQRLKSSEAMASVFARRLDALKHITPSKLIDNASPEAILCFYCGKRGHSLRDCLDIIESEFKDLLKDANLYDGFEETSCLCIRCFQFGHWAVACPYSTSRKQTWKHGNASILGGENSERRQNEPQNRNPLVGTCTISHGENAGPNTELMVCTNNKNGTMILDGRISDYKTVERSLSGEDCHKGMSWKGTSHRVLLKGENATSSFKGNEPNENQIMPYVNKQISSIPMEAFEIIRKLRLSRSDILKWMKPPSSNFCLEGFFLRLRLGKWEEGLGGTGYHVACISEASRESSSGKCKLPISVDIGGLRCAVDCRYVSNHDFSEDELRAWWCANLKGAAKLPRIEELHMKLAEKEKYGF
ncbi:hypothetical protein AAC387_Pa06g0561 [Persea americana]|eukprot:TRINITY_DN3081_c0_g1_i3.p1 TRINITY_DN3081_c0_g1~~TRINITY_DN3081_c0_g1_i3.p1  ORF type:complete len:1046 (+),score=225.03 TRINITY_DN3081_c0_g1_i3:317-3454(+)